MASLNSLQARALAAQSTAIRNVDDLSHGLRIIHTSTAAITSVTCTTATNLVLIDADGTTTSTFSGDSTLGAVADTINASSNWKCKILDGLRATASASGFVENTTVTASTEHGELGYTLHIDNDSLDDYLLRCTYDRAVGVNMPLVGHRVKLVKFTYNVDVNGALAGAVRIYEWDPRDRTETLIWAAASVDATETTHDFSKAPITAKEGNDLVILITDTTSITDSGDNFLQAIYVRE
ncbi:hypothetical protein LCGC14_2389040 [marine sediment metagenome]|uniref:Uncharacterized protein n=1 Tax=marine sediment metagenome TaxID=412755 RepID=A0A0F9CKT4_9ZZZZ